MSDLIATSLHLVSPALAFSSSTAPGDAAADTPLPHRIKILNWGENVGRTTGARILVGALSLSSLLANQERCACDSIELDYEHQSVKGHPNYKADPRHSAAHGGIEIIEGDGVYLSALDYTPNGKEHALSYKDVSGVVHTDKEGNLLLVRSVALTQNGDVSGMEFTAHVAALSAQSSPTQSPAPETKQTTMDPNENKDKYREILIKLLGLEPAEGATEITDEELASAAETAGTQTALSAKKPEEDAQKKKDDDPVIALSARLDAMDKDRMVDRATAEGKVIPLSAEEINAADISTLSAMIAKLPAGQVNTKSTVPPETPGEDVALSAEQKSVCKMLGISEDDFRKSNPSS